MQEVTLKYIAAKMNNLKKQGGSTILFLGAGASRSAGIPLASEIIDQLEKDDYYKILIEQRCKKKTYAGYMEALSKGDRRRFFKKYIEISNINTTHLYAAQLIAKKYVDCVVTTNFDNLMLKSLTLLNINPSVYDLTIARDNITSNFEFPAVIYLHGQNHGFWQLNTDYELELPVNAIRNAITKISTTRAWVVIGYSGNDPVLDQLASIDIFEDGLYWVCYQNEDPPENVRERLLDKNTNGSTILKGYNSDDFFRQLKIELGMDDPQIMSKPFSHLYNVIENIQPVIIDNHKVDLCDQAKKWINQAIKGFEEKEGFENKPEISKNKIEEDELLRRIKELYNNANYQEILNYEADIEKSTDPEINKYHAFVYWGWGYSLGQEAETKFGDKKEALLNESIDKYKKSIAINPTFSGPYHNWGLMLGNLSELKSGDEKAKLLLQSIEKYKKALEIEPDYDTAYLNWGWALGLLSEMKTEIEKEKLLLESIEKRKKAIEINPNSDLGYYNWGWALGEIAVLKAGEVKEKLLLESIDKYQKTVEINPGYYLAYYNWGWDLSELALSKTGNEKEKLLWESIEKRKKVLEINPNYGLAFENWGWALSQIAEMKSGEEKEKLLKESAEKYDKAKTL